MYATLKSALLITLSISLVNSSLWAETTAQKFPAGAIALLEAHQVSGLIERIENSGIPEFVKSTPQFQEYLESKDYQKAQAGKSIAETFLAMDLLTLAKKLTAGDISLAIYPTDDPKKPDSLLLLQVPDPAILKHLRMQLDPFLVLTEARTESEQEGRAGIETFMFKDKLYFALGEGWLLTGNRAALLDKALALKSLPDESLSRDPNLSLMQKQCGQDNLLSLYVNTHMIADPNTGRYLPAKLDNPVFSLLLGGLFEMAAHSPYAGATLNITENQLVFNANVQGQKADLPESHQSLFSDPTTAGTEEFPVVDNRQMGFTMHRDFSTWYQQREELLEEKVLPSFDQFETGLSNLLPGRDFGTDILPLLGNNLTFVTAPQSFDHLDGAPGVKLPGMALVVELADQKEGAQIFQLFFQTLTAILNIEAGQQGRQPWLVQTELYEDVNVQFGKYMEKPKGDRLPIVFNFMPASALVGDRYILSSSVDLCKKLIDVYQHPEAQTARPATVNKDLDLDFVVSPIVTALEDNKDLLHARAVKDGKDLEQAKQELELFLAFLKRLNHLTLDMGVRGENYQLNVTGSWN